MAWNIIITSFVVIFAIMVVAQLLYTVFADKSNSDSGGES